MIIKIDVTNKHATAVGDPVIVCGNSDYSIEFTFDEEWSAHDAKTARFVYLQGRDVKYTDVVFSGNAATVPVLANVRDVRVGVFAGNLCTTTPARIPCEPSIRCGTGAPADPTPSQYDQIMALLRLQGGGGGMIVNVTLDEGGMNRADVPYTDIRAAIEAQQDVRVYRAGYVFDGGRVSGDRCVFYCFTDKVRYIIQIAPDETVHYAYENVVQQLIGATAAAQGRKGYAPTPAAGQQDHVLHGDGTWRKIELPEEDTTPEGDLILTVGGESLDSLSLLSVISPPDAPDGYSPLDSIRAGRVTVMVTIGGTNEDDIQALGVADVVEIDAGGLTAHVNLVFSDRVVSVMVGIQFLEDLAVTAFPVVEFTGGVGAAELTAEVEAALTRAKESGEFKGEPGEPGQPGAPGAPGADYVLTDDDKTEIAQEAAGLIDTALLPIIGEVTE